MNIEELSGLGKITKEIEPFQNVKITFHTLSAGEEQKVNEFLTSYPNDIMARSKPLQIETLAHSIEAINGKPFTDIKQLREFLTNLQGNVLDLLYTSYLSLEKESLESMEKLKKNLETDKAV